MGQRTPRILITTSRDPAEQSRIFAKLLRHILPNALMINRGNRSKEELRFFAMNELCDYVYMVYSKENKVDRLVIFKIYSDALIQEGPVLKIVHYIDHKIFGFHDLPEKGPLSTSLETRPLHPDLIDYFQQYFFLELGKKNALWLAIDTADHKNITYVTFIDALTQRKFFYAQVKLENGDKL